MCCFMKHANQMGQAEERQVKLTKHMALFKEIFIKEDFSTMCLATIKHIVETVHKHLKETNLIAAFFAFLSGFFI